MESLYTTGHGFHGFPSTFNISSPTSSFYNPSSTWGSQEGIVALGVVLGSSISLVGLAFAFITYSLFSDLRSLAGTTLLSLLASLFMSQLLFVIGVGGIQDAELCLSLSLALLFMKLASLCWICCCCHHSLITFRRNTNISLQPEQKMGKVFAHYSFFSWGFPLLMLSVSAAFIYKERDAKSSTSRVNQIAEDGNSNGSNDVHCWLMHGSSYIWGFLVPASILLFVGFYLSAQLSGAVKLTAALQIDQRARNKIIRRRGLQVGLFFKLLLILTMVQLIGAIASITDMSELWAVYSVSQGIQGLLISMLVSCNCRILRLYAQPRGTKKRKENYTSLKDGEGGRFGILSVTNPNYENFATSSECDHTLVKMSYKEDNFVERNDHQSQQPINDKIFGDLSTALNINEIVRGPTPTTV
ncbi:hypothetical protein PVAND_004105 [Polypedilum vanderplanki]|uniref:G-protein coupled receptors family 2 profile 2 domain-containing protein n=1 Tax=Polypedilum vanderplanki TaxID=319348 RepID=A0A9J6BWP9_POLVA|nr:hypothetical protein PVAND_004105 [Polypedilum vanderplanki]